eukprot:1811238-Rhodomonas_salina.1
MRGILKEKCFTQVAVDGSKRRSAHQVPRGYLTRVRGQALFVGINYVGQQGELRGIRPEINAKEPQSQSQQCDFLGALYAMPGTNVAYSAGTHCPVQMSRMVLLRASVLALQSRRTGRYAEWTCGTEIAYGAKVPVWKSGTEIANEVGCHNDVAIMKEMVLKQGYDESEMKVLMDDGKSEGPTRTNIANALQYCSLPTIGLTPYLQWA